MRYKAGGKDITFFSHLGLCFYFVMNSCISAVALRRMLEGYFLEWTQSDMWRAHLQTLLWIWKVKAKWEARGMVN